MATAPLSQPDIPVHNKYLNSRTLLGMYCVPLFDFSSNVNHVVCVQADSEADALVFAFLKNRKELGWSTEELSRARFRFVETRRMYTAGCEEELNALRSDVARYNILPPDRPVNLFEMYQDIRR